jgi:nucleoside 2-deoxyribosyltransferase
MKWLNMKKRVSVYLASPWFNPEQEAARQCILRQLEKHSISYFSPKDEVICAPDAGSDSRKAIFNGNVKAIREIDFVIVNTTGKDMGTIFEAGVAFGAHKPIIYFWSPPADVEKPTLNLMLAQSGIAACVSEADLDRVLTQLEENAFDFQAVKDANKYTGLIE